MTFTSSEIDAEWFHCYENRIGILAGRDEPARWMVDFAKQEADALMAKLSLDNASVT